MRRARFILGGVTVVICAAYGAANMPSVSFLRRLQQFSSPQYFSLPSHA
jgi:hypothetical protein